jgi:hypothetical protein
MLEEAAHYAKFLQLQIKLGTSTSALYIVSR